jgi:hypothetical protein
MIPGNRYTVVVKIKLHTQPVRTLDYRKEGVFVKESPSCFIFDSFRVRKTNVIEILGRVQ